MIDLPYIKLDGKVAIEKDWPKIGVRKDFKHKGNIGVNCSFGLIVLDVDPRKGGDITLDGLQRGYGKLPETWVVETGRGDGGKHYYFKGSCNSFGYEGIDIKSKGGYVVCPPSLHPDTKQPYKWLVSPEDCELADCPQWIFDLAPIVKKIESTKQVNGDYDRDTVISALNAIDPSCSEPEWRKYGKALFNSGFDFEVFNEWSSKSKDKYNEQACIKKWESFSKQQDNSLTASTILYDANTKYGWNFPNIELSEQLCKELVEDLLPTYQDTVELTDDICPNGMLAWARDIATNKGTSIDSVLICGIAASAAACNSDITLQINDGWSEYATLHCVIYGLPSHLKTGTLNSAASFLLAKNQELRGSYPDEIKQYKHEMTMWRGEVLKWNKDVEKGKAVEQPPREPEMPKRKASIIQDATIEVAGVIASDNCKTGLLLLKDELRSLLDKFGKKEGGEQEKVFWTESYNNAFYCVDRMGREPVNINNLRINILGGVQDDYIKEFIAECKNDGFISRIQFVEHVMTSDFDPTITNKYIVDLHSRLYKLPTLKIILSTDAYIYFNNLVKRYRSDSLKAESKKWASWLGKRSGLLGRLCLLFALIDGETCEISLNTVKKAANFIGKFLAPHQLKLYRNAGLEVDGKVGMSERLKIILAFLSKKFKKGDTITVSTLSTYCRTFQKLTRNDKEAYLFEMIARGYLAQVGKARFEIK